MMIRDDLTIQTSNDVSNVNLGFFFLYKFFATALSVVLPLPVGLFTPVFVTGKNKIAASSSPYFDELL